MRLVIFIVMFLRKCVPDHGGAMSIARNGVMARRG
jgi:hypothetical protein